MFVMKLPTFLRLLLSFVLLLPADIVLAESLDEEQARYAAAEFFSPSSQSTRLRAKGRQLVLRSAGHERGYYIFDRPEGGVVFVADDDAIGRTVLGYTDSGSFDADHMPVGLQDWLEQMGVLMDAVHEGKIQRTDVRRKAGKTVVATLTQTMWDQVWPYNDLCPKIGSKNCVTGCVATAMAQIMKYWQWPEHGYGSVTYDDKGCGQTLSTDFSTHFYNWDHMLFSYVNDGYVYSDEQINAVATLMRDCGYAVRMTYSLGESNASISAKVLQEHFHYSSVAQDRFSVDYSEDMWHEFIRQDLLAGRPVLYNGHSMEGGHEFILDGFDTEGYYHVNWGWGGNQDGYFMLTNLNGYHFAQNMITHLMPDYSADTPFTYSLTNDGVLTITGKGMMPDEYQMKTAPWREECERIRQIIFSPGITSIPNSFGTCYQGGRMYKFVNLEEVTLPEGLLSIGEDAFMDADKLTAVQLPSTLVRMNYAFFDCNNIKSLHLPRSLEEFDDILPNLAQLTVDEANPYMSAADNVLYNKSGRILLFAPQGLDRIIIAETTEEIADNGILKAGTPILFKCMAAPPLPKSPTIQNRGNIYIPYGSSGYDNWEKSLPPGWRVMIYNINRIPEVKINWALSDGTLSVSGWGEQKYQEYGSTNAPYYLDRNLVQKLVVEEGITALCRSSFENYSNLTVVELPSTFSYLYDNCFAGSGITTITCYARLAPVLGKDMFQGMPTDGTLRVPDGTDYTSWLEALPEGWKIEFFTPAPMVTYTLYSGETSSVEEIEEWDQLLTSFPNAIGIINPRYEEWAYLLPNMLVEDTEAEGGYRCPNFRLTDLTYDFSSAYRAPWTGFHTPVTFTITKGEYKRKLNEGYNTVCLPFDINEERLPRGCHMYAYSHYDSESGNAVFSPQTVTEAGHACFIKSKSDVEWLADLSGMAVTAQQASTLDSHMRGTFVTTADYQSIGYSPRAKDNIFAPLAQYLHPFRACFIIDAPSAPTELRILISDEADSIQEIANSKAPSGQWYNLAGQRISHLQKGVNIMDGKKLIR